MTGATRVRYVVASLAMRSAAGVESARAHGSRNRSLNCECDEQKATAHRHCCLEREARFHFGSWNACAEVVHRQGEHLVLDGMVARCEFVHATRITLTPGIGPAPYT